MGARPRWRISLGQNGFISGNLHGYAVTADDILAHATDLAFDGIELFGGMEGLGFPGIQPYPDPDDGEAVAALRRPYDRAGLAIMGIQCAPQEGDPLSERPEPRATYARALSRQVLLAHRLGGEVAGVWPGGRRADLSDEEIVERLSDAFRQVAPTAEEQGVRLAMEPEPVQVDYSFDIALAVADAVDSPAFGILYDTTHANVLTGDPVGTIERLGRRIHHVHFADNDGTCLTIPGASGSSSHLGAGEGSMDLRAVLLKLGEVGYEGWVQADVWENPDPLAASRSLKRLLDEAAVL
jgi:sugar phosphate isomerase/epimerase